MSSASDSPIICRTTPWYVRRMGLMFLMLAIFSAWFFKDWKWGYPKKAAMYAEYQRITALPNGQEEWLKVSAEKGWPKAPGDSDKITQDKIDEQRNFTFVMGAGALAVLITFLLNRGKVLTADAASFTPPGSKTPIPFSSVFRVNKIKWRNKGLAYIHYKDASGAEKKAVIDDLKYGGAEQVLNRLLANFNGEIIDVEEAAPVEKEASAAIEEPADAAKPPASSEGQA